MGAFFVCAEGKAATGPLRPEASQRENKGPASCRRGNWAVIGNVWTQVIDEWSDAPLTTAIVHVFRGYAGGYSHPPLPRHDLVA